MDVDPGQPNFNLAGQLTLLRVKDLVLTNADFKDCELVKGFYLNTPTPNLNMKYYNACVERLHNQFIETNKDKDKVLIINTCGWVEGLGSEIQLKIMEIIQPQIVVTMTKSGQGLKGNEFSEKCRHKFGLIKYVDVENDPIDGQVNVKGAVQRNRKIINALSQSESDIYLFNNASQLDGSSQLPVKFQSKTIKRDDFSLSKSQAYKIQTRNYHTIPLTQVGFSLIREQLDQACNKIETLRLFNCQVIAGLKIDNAQFKNLKQYEDLRIIEIPFKRDNLPPIEILFYGLIRDIDYSSGLKIIAQDNIDISKLDFNAICLAHDSIFKFPSSYLLQEDTQEVLVRQAVANEGGRRVFSKPAQDVKYFMADLNPKKD